MKKILIEPSRSVDLCKDMMSSVCMFIAQYAVSNHDLPVYPSSSVMDHVNTFIVILQQDTTILNTRQYQDKISIRLMQAKRLCKSLAGESTDVNN